MKPPRMHVIAAVLLCMVAQAFPQTPLGTAFTYQGHLKSNDISLTGPANLQFSLWDAAGSGSPPVGGNQVGSTITMNGVIVTNGLFTVQLNAAGEFGPSAFNGDARWLQITVNGTTLSPRQRLTAVPYARFSTAPWTTSGNSISNTNAGSVGIGTTNPGQFTNARLDVVGKMAVMESARTYGLIVDEIGSAMRLYSDHTGGGVLGRDFVLGVYPQGHLNQLVLKNDGKVGVGTTTPAQKLDVIGTAQVTGFKMPTGAGSGMVLTSDGQGVGTWQAPAVSAAGPAQTSLGGGGTFSPFVGESASPLNLTVGQAFTSIVSAGPISEAGTYLVTWEVGGLLPQTMLADNEITFQTRISTTSSTSSPVNHIARGMRGDSGLLNDAPLSVSGAHVFVKSTGTAETVKLEWQCTSGTASAGQTIIHADGPSPSAVNRRIIVVRIH